MEAINQLNIPDRLYGREQDLLTLLESYDRIGHGQGEILLVPGYSGVGKTALVKELQKPVREKNGFFVSGKFDQYKQNIPYFAFRQALSELCHALESGDSLQRDRYKTEILHSVGSLGQLLVDMAPEFESLLGVQPSLGDISPQEARYRFAGVFHDFLKVICLPEHPLVLFIDDWQWADAASFELLKLIQVGVTLRYLVIIVSYRDNEVNASHPITTTLGELRRQAVPLKALELKNITESDVQQLVNDTLKPAPENIKELGKFIYNKTKGNPFFVRSFLNFLNEFNLLRFDNNLGRWQWIKDEINKTQLPDNVVDLFVMKLKRLDKDTRNLFSLAACLGNRFDLVGVSIITGLSTEECLALLSSGEAKTMLLPIIKDKSLNQKDNLPVSGHFMFLHDRVQQAAFSLIEKNELPDILLKIGRLLFKSLPPEILAERFFEVVNDLNAGLSLVHDKTERVQIIELNLTAAKKAYSATAYDSALLYCRAANQMIDLPGFEEYFWLNHHDLALQLYMEIAECEFLEGEVRVAENSIQQALTHARTPIEKANILNILIVQYTLASRYSEAISWGRQALAELGISLPDEGFEEARDQEIKLVRQELGNRSIVALIDLPVMSNPEMLMASKILITIGPPCYRSHQRLWSVIVPKVVNLTLIYGNIPQVGYSHTAFGGLLGWVDSDFASAKEFGNLATRLMNETFHSPSEQSVFYLMIGSSIRHWFKHLRFGTRDYKDAYEIGVQSGNMQYAAYAFGHNMYSRFYQGVPFDGLIAETEQSLEFSRIRLNQWAIDLLEGGLNIFGSLSGAGEKENGKDTWSEKKYLKNLHDHHNIQVECIYKVMRTFSFLMLGQFDRALISSEEAEPLLYTVGTQGLLPWPEHVFARFLILTALYSQTEIELQSKWRAELDEILDKLRIWAHNCPDNFEHKYLLASAELARIDLNQAVAMLFYDNAIEAAQTGSFNQWEGMANERAFNFMKETGNERLAQHYFQQAYVCYKKLGAEAKINLMEKDYRTYLEDHTPVNRIHLKSTNKDERGFLNGFIEKQIQHLRNYTLQMQQTELLMQAKTHTSELAEATQRLRVEIAERKRTEKALRESEMRFHSLFDNMSEGVALHELEFLNGLPYDYRIIDINPQFDKIIGVTRKQVVGKLSIEAYHSETPPYFDEYVDVAINKKILFFETYYAAMDKHFAISVVPWQENGFATIFNDITKLKKAEKEAIAQRNLSLTYFHIAGVMMCVLDNDGAIMLINKKGIDILGYEKEEELLGKNWFDLSLPENVVSEVKEVFNQLMKGIIEPVEKYENPVLTKNGEKRMIAFHNTIIHDEENKIAGVLFSGEDITERKHSEIKSQQQNQKLIELNATKDKFFSIIAHDLKSPFNSIVGFSDLLVEQVKNKDYDGIEKYADIVQKSSYRAMDLLMNLMEWSQSQTGRMEFNPEYFELGELIKETELLLNGAIEQKSISIAKITPSRVPVFADKKMIDTILRNLVSNAVKFTYPGGKITISVEEKQNEMLVSVSDNGVGISTANMDKLFKIDQSYSTAGTQNEKGTGLGLILCKEFVEKHGGKIWVESDPDGMSGEKGSVFYFTIPSRIV